MASAADKAREVVIAESADHIGILRDFLTYRLYDAKRRLRELQQSPTPDVDAISTAADEIRISRLWLHQLVNCETLIQHIAEQRRAKQCLT